MVLTLLFWVHGPLKKHMLNNVQLTGQVFDHQLLLLYYGEVVEDI